jgi:hypothetical protein
VILQINATDIVKDVAQVSPSGASGYGYLLVVLIVLIAAFGYATFFLFKRLDKARDEKGELLEKSFKITEAVVGRFDDVSDVLKEIQTEQKVHSSLLQTLLSK